MVCVNDYVTMYMHSIMSLRENAINLARLTTNPEFLLACGSFCLSFFSFCLILMDLQLRSLTLFTSKVFFNNLEPRDLRIGVIYVLFVCLPSQSNLERLGTLRERQVKLKEDALLLQAQMTEFRNNIVKEVKLKFLQLQISFFLNHPLNNQLLQGAVVFNRIVVVVVVILIVLITHS